MADGQSRLLLLIEARNQAKAEIQGLNQEIKRLQTDAGRPLSVRATDQASSTIRQVSAEKDKLDQAAGQPIPLTVDDQASGPVGDLVHRLNELNDVSGLAKSAISGIVTGASIALINQAVQATTNLARNISDLARASAESARVTASFEALSQTVGESSRDMLAALQRASQGAIDNTTLMLTANRAMLLGVADTSQEMATLMEVAAVRGRALGLTTAEAFDNIVTGVGRLSAPILDNLGIIVDSEAAYEAYALSVGKTADSLTGMEQKQALVNAVIASSRPLLEAQGGISADMATNFERADAAISNAKDALGQLFAPAVAIVAEQIALAATEAANSLEAVDKIAGQVTSGAGDFDTFGAAVSTALGGLISPQTRAALEGIAAIARGTSDAVQAVGDSVTREIRPASFAPYEEGMRRMAEAQAATEAANEEFVSSLAKGPAALQEYARASIEAGGSSEELRKLFDDNKRELEAFESAVDGARSRLVSKLSGLVPDIGADQAARLLAQGIEEIDRQGRELARGFLDGKISSEEFLIGINNLGSGTIDTANQMKEAADETRAFEEVLANGPASFSIFAAAAIAAGASVDEVIGLIRELKSEIGGIQSARDSAVRGLAGQLAGQVERGLLTQEQASDLFAEGVAKADRAAANLNTQLALTGEATDEFTLAQAQAFQAVNDGAQAIEEADRQAKRYASTLAGDAKRAAAEAAREFENLKGKVAGVLSGALDPGVGVDPDEILAGLGLREDAINENARRLADIAKKGFAGQEWLGDFAQEVPEVFKRLVDAADPKAEAARLLKDFQDGLAPELIDKETAKDRVRRMLLGEARMDELATEIAQELAAELGKPVAEVESRARAALGGGVEAPKVKLAPEIDAGALGGAFATGAANAVRDSGIGDRMTTALETQLKSESSLKKMMAAGEAQAQAWGQSFLDTVGENVPARLIEILTNLVTPGVMAQLQVQASLTGAR